MDPLAVSALGVSLISVAVAVQTHRSSVSVSNYGDATELTLDIDRLFIEHPELRPLFYENAAVDASVDRNRALAVAEFVIDAFECLWDMAKTYEPVDRTAWSDYIADMFRQSPILRGFYDACPAWYPAITSWLEEREVPTAAALVG